MWNRFLLALGMLAASAGVTAAQQAADTSPTQGPAQATSQAPASPAADAQPVVPGPGPAVPAFTPGPAPCCGAANQQSWVTAEYLVGWFSGDPLPTLVTTSPAGTPSNVAGVIGQTTTSTLFGGDKVNTNARSGGRLQFGYWLTPDRFLGIEAGAMIMESQATPFSTTSDGSGIIARPFTDAAAGTPQSVLVAYPGRSSGNVSVLPRSGNLYGANFDFTQALVQYGDFQLITLFGYRFLRYDEGLGIQQTINPLGPNFVAGTSVQSQDTFATQNEFHGMDFGLRGQYVWQQFTLNALGRLTVGQMRHQVRISGSQTVTVPGEAPVTNAGGVYALASNIGQYNDTNWTLLPQLDLTLGWQASSNVRVNIGYMMLWLNDLVMAGNQIDQTLNTGLFPPAGNAAAGAARPVFQLNRTDATLQALTLGVTFSY